MPTDFGQKAQSILADGVVPNYYGIEDASALDTNANDVYLFQNTDLTSDYEFQDKNILVTTLSPNAWLTSPEMVSTSSFKAINSSIPLSSMDGIQPRTHHCYINHRNKYFKWRKGLFFRLEDGVLKYYDTKGILQLNDGQIRRKGSLLVELCGQDGSKKILEFTTSKLCQEWIAIAEARISYANYCVSKS